MKCVHTHVALPAVAIWTYLLVGGILKVIPQQTSIIVIIYTQYMHLKFPILSTPVLLDAISTDCLITAANN